MQDLVGVVRGQREGRGAVITTRALAAHHPDELTNPPL